MDLFLFIYGINFVVAVAALCSYILFIKISSNILQELPKSLRLYIMVTIFPFAFMVAFCSFTVSIIIFTENTEKTDIFIKTRLFMAFAAQKLRISFFLVASERIVATIYLEKYTPFCTSLKTFYVMITISYVTTAIYMIPVLSHLISPIYWIFYENLIYFIVILHFSTIIVCKILHLKNKKMYKLLAYRVFLERRCQVLINLRVINNIWYPILIFAVIAPIGSIFNTLIFSISDNEMLRPFCNIHLSYNLSLLLIVGQSFFKLNNQRRILPMTKNTVLTPLGNVLPANISIDKYFGDLQKQWG